MVWTIIWSLGDHIIFAVEGPIGLKLARDGAEGRRLGQLGGARNLGVIFGVSGVWLTAKLVGDRYDLFYLAGALCAVVAGWFYLRLGMGRQDPPSRRLVWRRQYGIFYAISALFGIRKQIFLVFSTWVLVSLHHVPVSPCSTSSARRWVVLLRPSWATSSTGWANARCCRPTRCC